MNSFTVSPASIRSFETGLSWNTTLSQPAGWHLFRGNEMIEKYKALEAENKRLKPRHEAYVKMLGELLAVLHADGGHYQYEHGTEKAVADAITKYYEIVKQLDEYKRQSQNEAEIKQLEKIIHRQQFIEDRYEELMLSCRRCWRYYGADHELFTASMKAMDFLIRRHATEIDEMNEEDNDDRPDNLPSND